MSRRDLRLGGDVVKAEVATGAMVFQECAEGCGVNEPTASCEDLRCVTCHGWGHDTRDTQKVDLRRAIGDGI